MQLNRDRIPEPVFCQVLPVIDVLNFSNGSIRCRTSFAAAPMRRLNPLLHAISMEHKTGNSYYTLKLTNESGGAQSRMATAPLVLDTPRRGVLFVAGELDSALRPAMLDFSNLLRCHSYPCLLPI